jgi:hypothetical protein
MPAKEIALTELGLEPLGNQLARFLQELDADSAPAEMVSRKERCSGASEAIHHNVGFVREKTDQTPHKSLRLLPGIPPLVTTRDRLIPYARMAAPRPTHLCLSMEKGDRLPSLCGSVASELR